jgi:hypothetical protein
MDAFTVMAKVVETRWDTPFRFVASLAVLVALIGSTEDRTPVLAVGSALDWAGVDGGLESTVDVHAWFIERADEITAAAFVAAIVGVILSGLYSRGGAVVMVALAIAAEVDAHEVTLVPVAVFVVWVALGMCRMGRNSLEAAHDWLSMAVAGMILSAFYAVILPAKWVRAAA